MTLDKKTIKNFAEKLLEEKSEIEKELKEMEKDLDFGSDTDHFEEETDQAEELVNQLGVKKELNHRLGDINDALDKIESGKYGICEKCGNEIELEVLEVDPESRLCHNCKKTNN